jgi:hypothetical protein
MRRITLVLLSVGLVLGVLIATAGATGAHDDSGRADEIVRWDLSQIVDGVILPGGGDVAAADGETITLTGSGHVEPGERDAFGGGTFVHEDAGGTLVAKGVYYVTEFRSWEPLKGGTLAGTGLIDGIADMETASSGILKVGVKLVAAGGSPQFDGELTVFCHLPGTIRDIPEGVALEVAGLHFDRQVSGVTIFHILDD